MCKESCIIFISFGSFPIVITLLQESTKIITVSEHTYQLVMREKDCKDGRESYSVVSIQLQGVSMANNYFLQYFSGKGIQLRRFHST